MEELQKLLPDFDAENQHFRCMAHIFNLGVQDFIKNLARNSNFEDVHSGNGTDSQFESDDAVIVLIFTKIRRNEKLNKRFHSVCETVSVPTNISPILDCPTTWNSTHDMIGIALKLETRDFKLLQQCF